MAANHITPSQPQILILQRQNYFRVQATSLQVRSFCMASACFSKCSLRKILFTHGLDSGLESVARNADSSLSDQARPAPTHTSIKLSHALASGEFLPQ